MRKIKKFSLCLLAVLQLCGCAALLERSYSVSEPYADRYWDSSAEDTLRVESYQDLVNSLLMLIEQRAEEGVIRCYGEVGDYTQALAAKGEVVRETMLGSYLLKNMRINFESGTSYSTLTCTMSYREDAEDIDSLMVLSDSQSLVDLLRLTVREERDKLTARFAYDTPREDVTAAVESFWQELCRSEMEANPPESEPEPEAEPEPNSETTTELSAEPPAGEPDASENPPPPEDPIPEGTAPEEEPAPEPGTPSADDPEAVPASTAGEPDPETPEEPPEDVIEYPPCPWEIRFYPNQKTAEIVEVLLKDETRRS